MHCELLHSLIDLYLDDELDGLDRAEIEGHASMCSACADALGRRSALKMSLRALQDDHVLEPEFSARMSAALTRAAVERGLVVPESRWKRPLGVSMFALTVLAIPTFLLLGPARLNSAPDHPVAEDVRSTWSPAPFASDALYWHTRAFPVEVTGPDAAVIESWFQGKTDFPVQAPLGGPRVHLLGARIANIGQQPAALLIYDYDGRKLSLLQFDAIAAGAPPESGGTVLVQQQAGYQVALTLRGGIGNLWIADLPRQELVMLAGEPNGR